MATTVRTTHRSIPIGPYKLRPVLDQIRGLAVADALVVLKVTPRAAAQVMRAKLQASASAAVDRSLDPTGLVVSAVFADQQTELKRQRIRSRGRTAVMRKRSSTVTIELTHGSPTRRVAPLARRLKPSSTTAGTIRSKPQPTKEA